MAENYAFRMKDESISHHGIEGQKWGVRNGPPYPLGSGQHSKAEVRAMKKEAKQARNAVKRVSEKEPRRWNISRFDENLSNIISKKIKENESEYLDLYKKANQDIYYISKFEESPEYAKYVDRDLDRSIEKGWIKESDRDKFRKLYFYDDLGQNLYEEWLSDNPDKFKEYTELHKESEKYGNQLKQKLSDVAKTTLGKYAYQEIAYGHYGGSDKAYNILEKALGDYLSEYVWSIGS